MPRCGFKTLADLKGHPILIATFARETFWAFLKSKYGFTDDQARPYAFSLQPFIADKTLSQQGYLTVEPFLLAAAGVKPTVFLLSDYGYNPYSNVLMVSKEMVAAKPDVIQRFVDASIKGWYGFLNGPHDKALALIMKGDPDYKPQNAADTLGAFKEHGIIDSGDAKTLGIGAMTDARWKSFFDADGRGRRLQARSRLPRRLHDAVRQQEGRACPNALRPRHGARAELLEHPARLGGEILVAALEPHDLHAQRHVLDREQRQVEGRRADRRRRIVVPGRADLGLALLARPDMGERDEAVDLAGQRAVARAQFLAPRVRALVIGERHLAALSMKPSIAALTVPGRRVAPRAQRPAELPQHRVEEEFRRARGRVLVGRRARRRAGLDHLDPRRRERAQKCSNAAFDASSVCRPAIGILPRQPRRAPRRRQLRAARERRVAGIAADRQRDVVRRLPRIARACPRGCPR